MPQKQVFVERDHRGRERLVISGGRRRSPSGNRSGHSTSEHLMAAQEQIQALQVQIGQLQTRLSFEQSQLWNAKRENERLIADNHHLQSQAQEVRRLEDLLYAEEKRADKLEEKYRLMKRGSSQRSRSGSSEYRRAYEENLRAYEEKSKEVELLRVRLAERDELHRLDEARIADKNRSLMDKNTKIQYFKDYLRTHGFRVQD